MGTVLLILYVPQLLYGTCIFLFHLYRRKQHARRSRQNRQQTQPVDKEIMQKLLEQDNMKEKAREKVTEFVYTLPLIFRYEF